MAFVLGLFLLVSIIVGLAALFRRSPVRRWYANRRKPRSAAIVSITGWAIVFLVLLIATTSPPQKPRQGDTPDAVHTATPTAAPPSSVTGDSITAATPNGVPADAQQARVHNVIDGDTLRVAALGAGAVLPGTAPVDARLLEIDAPETTHPSEPEQCYGREAATRLTTVARPGSTVWVQRDETLRDPYGRYLLYLWNDEGVFVNLELVTGGYAQATLYPPNDLHWPQIGAAGQAAQNAATGLWGACAHFGASKHAPETEPPPHSASPPPPASAPSLESPPSLRPPPSLKPVPSESVPSPESPPSLASAPSFPPPPGPGQGSYPYPPDLDCSQIDEQDFTVQEGDPHGFDDDGDGIGCES